jgi:hypothetical protein
VTIDGVKAGVTPLNRLSRSAGIHHVRLLHPAFEPLDREAVVRPGETTKVVVDFNVEGVRKK